MGLTYCPQSSSSSYLMIFLCVYFKKRENNYDSNSSIQLKYSAWYSACDLCNMICLPFPHQINHICLLLRYMHRIKISRAGI